MAPTRRKDGTLRFAGFPTFRPNVTPREMFQLGVFGGGYWRPIEVRGKTLRDQHKEFPASWWRGIAEEKLARDVECAGSRAAVKRACAERNHYGAVSGSTLAMWREKGWIEAPDHYGWVQWYCRFYNGRRSDDDARQIERWMRYASTERGRFRKRKEKSAVVMQGLLQWAVKT